MLEGHTLDCGSSFLTSSVFAETLFNISPLGHSPCVHMNFLPYRILLRAYLQVLGQEESNLQREEMLK